MTFIVSPKQKRIIDLALDGLSNQQIGLRLGNTEGGIEQNMVKIFKIIKEAGYVIKSRAGLKQRPDEKFSKDIIALETDYSAGSGGFNNALSKLSTLGLIKRDGGQIQLNDEISNL